MAEAKNEETRQPTIESLTAENVRLQGELDVAQGIIAGQAEQIANSETAQQQGTAIIVTHEKQQYRVLGKQFNVKGVVIKAEDLGKNKEAVKQLIDTKSGLLQLVPKVAK